MFSTKILIKIIFKNDLLFIFNDLNQTEKTLENFNNSYLKFNFFLKFLITGYIILCFFLNIIFIIIFFLQVKNKFFWENQSIFKENSVSKECSKFYNRKLIVTH